MLTPFDQAVQDIITAGQRLNALGLVPATAGNFSVRLPESRIAVTVSGRHKGRLTPADIMKVDAGGKPLENKKPSDETKLHAHIYKLFPEANAILHGHSVPGTILTRIPRSGDLVLRDYEMLKIFPDIRTHDVTITIPVVNNSQNMDDIIAELQKKEMQAPAYLIRNHGFYVWGRDMFQAENIVEALEYMMACELEMLKLRENKYEPTNGLS